MKHCLYREAAVLVPDSGCRPKLILNTVLANDHEQARAQDGAEDLGPKVHEGHSPPLVVHCKKSFSEKKKPMKYDIVRTII